MYIQEPLTLDQDADENLSYLKAIGVDYIALRLPKGDEDAALRKVSTATEFFERAKAKVASHGLKLHSVQTTEGWEQIKLGLADAGEKIEAWCAMLEGMGAAGIPLLAYNFKVLKSLALRSQPMRGRGGAAYKSYDHEQYLAHPAPPYDPPVSEARMWDNVSRFLKRVVPVAEKAGVRMACHPDDPPLPRGVKPLAGVAHIASSFDDFRRIFDIAPSASNGMLFCQGCVKEMQGVNVYEAIRDIGRTGKIVMVHFRNVRGAFPQFQETFIDEGDVDMYRAMVAYRDAGFAGPYMMDHCPSFPQEQWAGRAFAVGYMRGLIHAVYR